MAIPSKADQEAEGKARLENGVQPGESAQALDVIDDSGEGRAPVRQTTTQESEVRTPPPVTAKFDDKRAAIVARFRQDRDEQAAEQADEISEFTRSGMPPEFAEPNAPVIEDAQTADAAGADAAADQGGGEVAHEDAAAADSAAPPAADATADTMPKTVKVKVNGVVKELPYEEVIAKAQMALAADDILGEAKTLRRELQTIVHDAKNTAPRAGQPGHHAGQDGAQTGDTTATDPPLNQEDPIEQLIEKLQYGDPTEAKTQLRTVISEIASGQVNATLAQNRLNDEGARTAKVLTDFESQNPEIAKDPLARAVIERKVLDLQVEDIRALGVDPAKLRSAVPGRPTPGEIADAHLWYRSQGFQVRSPAQMLEKAIGDFKAWKGVAPSTEQAEPARQGAPRVEVNVDRTARREAIPQQPSRAAAPRQTTPQAVPARRDPSSVVDSMRQSRMAPRTRGVVA